MKTTIDPKHPEFGELPVWNLADLYSGPKGNDLTNDLARLKNEAIDFKQRYENKIESLSSAEFFDAIKDYEKISEDTYKISSYAQSTFHLNMNDPETSSFYNDSNENVQAISAELIFFTLEINRMEDAVLAPKMTDARLEHYEPWLKQVRLYRPHRLSDELEHYIHKISLVGSSAWIRLYDETIGGLRFNVDGEELANAEAFSLLSNPNRTRREAVWHEIVRVAEKNMGLTSLIMNTLIKDKAIDDELRHFATPQSARHLSNMIEPEVVDALHKAVKDSFAKLYQRYFKMKAKWLGVEKLEMWDRLAPISTDETHVYTWSESRQIVMDAYRDFSPALAELIIPFFEKGWIDAPSRAGKYSGAYMEPCTTTTHPFILLNYSGKHRDVTTLAHELGHGVHQCLSNEQGFFLAGAPLTLAETASVFGEMLTFQSMLKKESDPVKRKTHLARKVEDMMATVFRQIAFYEFELRNHEQRKNGELTPQQFCDNWRAIMMDLYGDAFNVHENDRFIWMYITHFFHTPFYVYAYAFGDCLVNALYATYLAQPEGFEEKYLTLLRSGGRYAHKELLAPFGLDATNPSFWQRGLSVIENLMDQIDLIEKQETSGK